MAGSTKAHCPARTLPNFDPVAHLYRWAEYLTFGALLQRTRTHFLAELADTRQAMLLGDGDGRFAQELLRRAPRAHVTAVDTSRAMLRLLQRRCAGDGNDVRLRLIQGSALEAPSLPHRDLATCDLVVTHFFLDCLAQGELETLAHRLAAELKPGSRWLVSDFGLPLSGPGRWLALACIRLLYLAFRLLTQLKVQHLPDPQIALRNAGFLRCRRWAPLGGFLYSELWVLPR